MPLNKDQQTQFDVACSRIADGESLRSICEGERKGGKGEAPAAPTAMDWVA